MDFLIDDRVGRLTFNAIRAISTGDVQVREQVA